MPLAAAETRFEDFNRRLIVGDAFRAGSASDGLPPRAFNDFPVRFGCDGDEWRAIVRRELRPSYPVIIDWSGMFATLGGVGIHYGAEMRKVGDYPYTLPLEHPHFMEASHFNPRFSPLLVHWEMIGENFAAHVKGEMPRIGADSAEPAAARLSEPAHRATAAKEAILDAMERRVITDLPLDEAIPRLEPPGWRLVTTRLMNER